MTTLRDSILILAALCIAAVCLCVLHLADKASDDWHRATDAVVQSAGHFDAHADQLATDAEGALKQLAAAPQQIAASLEGGVEKAVGDTINPLPTLTAAPKAEAAVVNTATNATAPALSALQSLSLFRPTAKPTPTPSHP